MTAVTLERLPGRIARVTIDRPSARNAVNGEVTTQLEAIVDETEADPEVWLVVLTGAGTEAFCAGADLKEIAAGRGATLRTERGGFAGFVYSQRRKPWIAAVNGAALAGGCEIVLACDLVVAADTATFGVPEVQRGLVAGAGGLYRLPRALPRNVALELALTGGTLSAESAHRFGLANRLVPAVQVMDAALELARAITRNAPLAVRESLHITRLAHELDENALRALSVDALKRMAGSEDLQEGLRAFIEKRAPQWRGA
jgi:enoyl-CoA hydratase/carnithine racemase